MMVRVSETYDLSTVQNKMGLIGIHTPDLNLIKKLWSGLIQNHRFMRFVGCDVAMACASMLPADPLQIGVEAGDIAPQDMFNPILYKAVSNDSYNLLINRIIASEGISNPDISVIDKNSVISVNNSPFNEDGSDTEVDPFSIYYALLAEPDGWRKAMPQSGLEMKGLYPIVFSLVSNMGNNAVGMFGSDTDTIAGYVGGTVKTVENDFGRTFRGPSMRMPRIPTVTIGPAAFLPDSDAELPLSAYEVDPPTAYVAALVLPPAKLNRLYYRMKVTWTIEFSEPRPLTEITTWTGLATVGSQAYGTDYVEQSSKMSVKTSSVDASGAEVKKIMEAGR